VAVSADIARIVTEIEGVPSSKVVTIPNGVDTERFRPPAATERVASRRAFGIPDGEFVVGSVGRLAVEKNYGMLIEAFARFRSAGRTGRLLIVGEGPCRAQLEKQAHVAGMKDACLLPGHRDDVAASLAGIDVFCLSSTTEGTSITLLEAGAVGLPAIVTDVGGNREVVADGKTGAIVGRDDAGGLAEWIRRLCADSGLRATWGIAARQRVVERYSVEQMLALYQALYGSIV
jgi:glycosyltransferase involved in cell wall biosynthesis